LAAQQHSTKNVTVPKSTELPGGEGWKRLMRCFTPLAVSGKAKYQMKDNPWFRQPLWPMVQDNGSLVPPEGRT